MDQPLVGEESQPKVAKVTFNPALWLQRRTWVLNQLREHRATSPNASTSKEDSEPTLDIHISHLVGLDIETESLKIAVEETAPIQGDRLNDLALWERPRPRWLDLDVQVWQGGLEVLNGDDGENKKRWFGRTGEWDAIVSTEVCVGGSFAIFGVYAS
ncbi:hypothetical protein FRC01_000442 [Tulasnella sp. 417]|nr:hypothetical protein FRC01_000442 [Tulasnella sp. 417]